MTHCSFTTKIITCNISYLKCLYFYSFHSTSNTSNIKATSSNVYKVQYKYCFPKKTLVNRHGYLVFTFFPFQCPPKIKYTGPKMTSILVFNWTVQVFNDQMTALNQTLQKPKNWAWISTCVDQTGTNNCTHETDYSPLKKDLLPVSTA